MNRALHGNSKTGTDCTNIFSFGSSMFPNQQSFKQNDNKAFPNRRRSRLGTYRTSLANQEFLNQKKDLSQKKKVVIPSEDEFEEQNNGVKKRLFTRSPISRRLNMDTSSIILASTENQDPDVTGVCSLMGESAKKSCPKSVNNDKFQYNAERIKFLSSIENNTGKHLRSAKKTSTPLRPYLPTKSPASTKKFSFTNDVIRSVKHSRLKKDSAKTPSPPKPFYLKNYSQKMIETPEMPASVAAALAAIKKSFSTTASVVAQSEVDKPDYLVADVNKSPEIDLSNLRNCLPLDSNKSPIRESVCSRLFDDKADEKNTTYETNNSLMSAGMESNNASTSSYVIIKNKAVRFDPQNLLEAAYARVNGTYNIIEPDDKVEESSTTIGEQTRSSFIESLQNEILKNDIKESNNSASEIKSKAKDKSPSFIVFNKKVNHHTYDLDTTDTFVYNESLYNDNTLKFDDTCFSHDEGGSTIKKEKKLSIIAEETELTNRPSTSTKLFTDSSVVEQNSSFNPSMQITTCEIDKTNEVEISSAVNNILSKMCDTVKHIEKSKKERELFFKRHDVLIENLNNYIHKINLEKEQFLKEQSDEYTATFNSLKELKNEFKVFFNCTNPKKYNFLNSTKINNAFKDAEKLIDAYSVPVGVLKTPNHTCRTLSKSVYNQLKIEYSCLKTPKAGAVKNIVASSAKILTPHSMSLCVQDQVDQLFNEK